MASEVVLCVVALLLLFFFTPLCGLSVISSSKRLLPFFTLLGLHIKVLVGNIQQCKVGVVALSVQYPIPMIPAFHCNLVSVLQLARVKKVVVDYSRFSCHWTSLCK